MIKSKLEGMFFFQMSNGSYSDYSVGSLYVCDHKVEEAEWDAHYKSYQGALDDKRKEVITADYQINPGAYVLQCREWTKFRDSLERPEVSFCRMHNLVEVECIELWRD